MTFESAPRPPATSEVCRWVVRYFVLDSPHTLARRGAMPIARMTSALRRLASASPLRVPTCAIDAGAEPLIERGRDADEHTRAKDIEHALKGEQCERQDRQRHQSRNAPAWKHPIVDLEHVERAGQVEDIDQTAHQRDGDECVPTGGQRLAQFGRRRRAPRGAGQVHKRHQILLPRPSTAGGFRLRQRSICNFNGSQPRASRFNGSQTTIVSWSRYSPVNTCTCSVRPRFSDVVRSFPYPFLIAF